MKKIFVLVIFGLFSVVVQAQQYISHIIKDGENVASVAKQYQISVEEIYALNPDAKKGVKRGTILVLPNKSASVSEENIRFKKHKVRRKETLFSIAKKYNITIDDIKKYNKHLYAKSLKKGEKIRIPLGLPKTIVSNNQTTNPIPSADTIYIVKPKDTKYGIAHRYGIPIGELEKNNPHIKEGLKPGMKLNVPILKEKPTTTTLEDEFQYYEVQPKEGFYRLKVKLGLSKEEIIALNPFAKNGLKAGMILKIPKKNNPTIFEENTEEIINLETKISNFKTKNIAVMLPFSLNEVSDSIEVTKNALKKSKRMRVAVDFYTGVLMALEFAKEIGLSSNVTVYDTQGSTREVESIITTNNFNDVDVVIGPLLEKNVSKAAQLLKQKNVPVFSPLSSKDTKLYANLFQTIPSQDILEAKMIDFLKKNQEGKNSIIIADSKHATQKQKLFEALPQAKEVSLRTSKEGEFIYATDLENIIDPINPNWVILETDNPVVLSNVIGLLNGLPKNKQVRLFTLDKNKAYDYHDISNMHLGNLYFTCPAVQKPFDPNEINPFIASYKNKYGVLPNSYAIRGFDVTYDILLRLGVATSVYEAYQYPTQYIESKFKYAKKMFSGYQNVGAYILTYKPDLSIEVLD
jgi:LysM repeat protein